MIEQARELAQRLRNAEVVLFSKDADTIDALVAEIERLKVAMNQWLDKTEWVQETVQPQELGMHRADVLRKRIDALRAELEAIKSAEPDNTALLRQALEALEKAADTTYSDTCLAQFNAAITTIKEELK